MVMIIIIDKTAFFEPWRSLEDSDRFDQVFTLCISQVFFLQSKVVSLASTPPQPGEQGIYIYVPQRQGGPPLRSSDRSSWLQIQRFRVRLPVLPDFLRSSGSGTGSTQPREDT
jgi:hypothetical protein